MDGQSKAHRKDPGPEGPALTRSGGVITFTDSVQVSAQPPAKKTAGQIEKETYKRRTSNAQHRTSNMDDVTLCPF